MNRSFLFSLWLSLAVVASPGIAFSQPQGEAVRPMSVVPTDEPALAPSPLRRGNAQEQQVPKVSNAGKTTQSDVTSTATALDLQSQPSP
jgi:hypothetical protein